MADRETQQNEEPQGTGEPQAPASPARPNTASLLLSDIVMRTGTSLLRGFVERSFLKGRYGAETAREVTANRSLGGTLLSIGIARMAARSLPGAALLGTGLITKALYERGKARRDRMLEDQSGEGEAE